MREESDDAADIEPLLALGNGAAHDHVLDLLGIDLAALDQRGDDLRCQLVGAHPRQRALLGEMEGRAQIAGDDHVLHVRVPFRPPELWAASFRAMQSMRCASIWRSS